GRRGGRADVPRPGGGDRARAGRRGGRPGDAAPGGDRAGGPPVPRTGVFVPARAAPAGRALDADTRAAARAVRARRARVRGAVRELAGGPPRDPRPLLLPERRTGPGPRLPRTGRRPRRATRRPDPGSPAVEPGPEGRREDGRRRRPPARSRPAAE